MRRRDLLAGITFAVAGTEAQQTGPQSLYIPKAHLVEDRALLHEFMDEYSFVELVTSTPSIHITHIPVLLDRTGGPYGTLFGHISRNNPQGESFDGRQPAVIVFRGPHSYISPSWYAKQESVPTWNFAVVHASGKLKPVTDKKTLHDFLAKLIAKFEGRYPVNSTYDFSKLPDSYTYGMIGGIIGFEMQIESLEGKFKLGQERNAADKAGILKNLSTARQDRSIREFTASFYEHLAKSVQSKEPA
jgi:transcriptional regulator